MGDVRGDSIKIEISGFKSIKKPVEFNLAPLNILLGPPASGKSNILDAIAILGYFARFLFFDKEYGGNPANIESLPIIARFNEPPQLFNYSNLANPIKISIKSGDNPINTLRIFYERGKLNVILNDKNLPWDLMNYQPEPIKAAHSAIASLSSAESELYDARLYGYDRYGLASTQCPNDYTCSFPLRLKGVRKKDFPGSILSEFGWNALSLIKSSANIIVSLNRKLRDYLDQEIEVRYLRRGELIVFDYGIEIEFTSVSDSIFRVLYYLMSIQSALNYAKLKGEEKKFILLLEEPEAHIFPFFLDLLVDQIKDATKDLYVIITTHNPIFSSMVWDKVEKLSTYYTTRDDVGNTLISELDVKKLTDELKTSEDILFMSPKKVLEKYTIKPGT